MRPITENYISQGKHGTYNAVDYSAYKDKAKTIFNPDYYAPEDGKITAVGNSGACGLRLELTGATGRHGFCHNELVYVKLGQTVKKGQKLARMGYTGYTIPSGPAGRHVHHVLFRNGVYVYPPSLINEPFNPPAPKPTGDDMPIPDQDNYYWRFGQKLAQQVRGRQLSRDEFRKHLVGKLNLTAVEILSDDPEADGYYALGQWAKANKAKITQQLTDQEKQLKTQANEILTLKAELKILSDETIKLTKTLAERPTKEDYDKLVKDNEGLAKQLEQALKQAEEDGLRQVKPPTFNFNDWFSDLLNKLRGRK